MLETDRADARNTLLLILSLVIGFCCAIQVYSLYQNYAARSDFLFWDPAAHAFYGVKIAADVKNLRLLTLLQDTNNQVLWPPLHSFLQLPFMIFFGTSFSSSFLCSLAFYCLFFGAITFLYQQVESSMAGWCVLMAFVATSPILAGYGAAPMLEIFGAAFMALSAALYLRKSKLFPLSLALLFFLKYNYCLYVALPVVAIAIWNRLPPLAGLKRFRLSEHISGFRIFVGLYGVVLCFLLITGGFKIGSISIRGVGNPLTVLAWILVIRALVKKEFGKYWEKVRASGWTAFVVPVFVWMLIPVPNRFRTMIHFAINEPVSGLSPSQASFYTFYFTKFSLFFSSHAGLFVCIAGAALTAIVLRKDEKVKFLAVLFLFPLLMLTLNQNKSERQIVPVFFPLWVLVAFGVSRIRPRSIQFLAAGLVCFLTVSSYDFNSVKPYIEWSFIPVESIKTVRFIVREISQSHADEIRVLGARNDISEALLLYQVAKHNNFAAGQPHISWELESEVPAGVHIIAINTESKQGDLIGEDVFADGTRVSHYVVP